MNEEQVFRSDKLLPGLSVDCVIFGFHENELRVLLLKLHHLDKWALPGGFVEKDKDVDAEAVRVLKQRTGLDNIFLRQFHLFGNVDRNEEGHAKLLVENKIISPALQEWFEQRFVTVGYYALVEYSRVKEPRPDHISAYCRWYALHEIPQLMLDHGKILDLALASLRRELNHLPVGLNLLPSQFTMPELQALYETILGKKLDRRNFRRKMLSFDILTATGQRRSGGSHKAPMLYQFDAAKYEQTMKNGLNSGW